MARLEVAIYGAASLALALLGGWLFIHGANIGVIALCATWSLLTVCVMVRVVRAVMRHPDDSSVKSGADAD